jgi:hypothetical protein
MGLVKNRVSSGRLGTDEFDALVPRRGAELRTTRRAWTTELTSNRIGGRTVDNAVC